MINTFAIQNREGYISQVASGISDRTIKGAAQIKQQAGVSFRKIVAIVLFAMGAFVTLGSTVNLALAKKIRKASHNMGHAILAHSGQFRLLNIYNTLKTSRPGLISAMNRATVGLASWYGGIFQGRKTAMGTTYNMNQMTAAHRSLPLGTWVRVTNMKNGRSVVVQVTDRGPYVANRIMDLSHAAAERLGYADAGTTQISMKVLGDDANTASEASLMSAPAVTVADATDTSNAVSAAASMITPAVFRVQARSYNVPLSDSSSDPVSNVIAAVSDIANGSTAQVAADLFA